MTHYNEFVKLCKHVELLLEKSRAKLVSPAEEEKAATATAASAAAEASETAAAWQEKAERKSVYIRRMELKLYVKE